MHKIDKQFSRRYLLKKCGWLFYPYLFIKIVHPTVRFRTPPFPSQNENLIHKGFHDWHKR